MSYLFFDLLQNKGPKLLFSPVLCFFSSGIERWLGEEDEGVHSHMPLKFIPFLTSVDAFENSKEILLV